GRPITAEDVMYDGTPVSGPSDVRKFLLKYSDQFVRNLTENLLTYATGRGVEYYDMPVVRSIVREAEQDDYRFESLILEVVKSGAFKMSTVPGDDATVIAQAGD